jgi:hypothetical protein
VVNRRVATLRSVPVVLSVGRAWPLWAGALTLLAFAQTSSHDSAWYVGPLSVLLGVVLAGAVVAGVTAAVVLVALRCGVPAESLVIRVPLPKRVPMRSVPSSRALLRVALTQLSLRVVATSVLAVLASRIGSGLVFETVRWAALIVGGLTILDVCPVFWSPAGWIIKAIVWARSGDARRGDVVAARATILFARVVVWGSLIAAFFVSGWLLLLIPVGSVIEVAGRSRAARLAAGIEEERLWQLLQSMFRPGATGGQAGPAWGGFGSRFGAGPAGFGGAGPAPTGGSTRPERVRVAPIDVRIIDDRGELESESS